jgi:rhodanese-related sulfurtransferase
MTEGAANKGDAFPQIDAATAGEWLESGTAMLIDVRETHEFEYENVPGSFLLPLSFLDPELFPAIADMRIVVMCAIGKRSAAAQKQLVQFGRANVYNLEGGLDAWKKEGLETQGGKFESMDYSI